MKIAIDRSLNPKVEEQYHVKRECVNKHVLTNRCVRCSVY